MLDEYDEVTCTGCREKKKRKSYGESPNGRRKYYFDENFETWKGKRCPACVRRAHTKYMRKYRGSDDLLKKDDVLEGNVDVFTFGSDDDAR